MKNNSSIKVGKFLKENNLHKKDFAQMIGVTLSYIYNLIDEDIPFSTRSVTIERIATVMGILPEDFEEYVIEEDPAPYNPNLQKLKEYIKKSNMSVVSFLRLFERKKRLKMVDILRGAKSLPIDFNEMKNIKKFLNIDDEEFFNFWRDILTEYLEKGGFDIKTNRELLDDMFLGAKKHI